MCAAVWINTATVIMEGSAKKCIIHGKKEEKWKKRFCYMAVYVQICETNLGIFVNIIKFLPFREVSYSRRSAA